MKSVSPAFISSAESFIEPSRSIAAKSSARCGPGATPGWAAAVEGLAQRLPPLRPWVWTWLGACRLPAEPPLQPSPTLLHDLVAVLQRQYGNEAVFVPARPAYEIPPITRRPKSKQASPASRQKKPRASF